MFTLNMALLSKMFAVAVAHIVVKEQFWQLIA